MKNRVSFSLSALFATILLSVSAVSFAADTPAAAPDAATPAAVAPADATAAPATAGPAETKETVDNPYGLEAVWHGDFISKGTLIILSIMSMGSWYILITKLIDQF
ncbi:hypothetical protein AAKU58_004153, partial [Oxalobacteraceae bacterium GrIS 1.18]